MMLRTILSITALLGTPVAAQGFDLPQKVLAGPPTTNSIPHVQLGDIEAIPELSDALLRAVENLPGVELGPTQISMPGAVGFQLRDGLNLANPDAIVGGREFAHLHPDGSLHASLEPDLARAAVSTGWATPHPWAKKRESLAGFVMIYTPQSDEDLTVVIRLVKASYAYVTGRDVPNQSQ